MLTVQKDNSITNYFANQKWKLAFDMQNMAIYICKFQFVMAIFIILSKSTFFRQKYFHNRNIDPPARYSASCSGWRAASGTATASSTTRTRRPASGAHFMKLRFGRKVFGQIFSDKYFRTNIFGRKVFVQIFSDKYLALIFGQSYTLKLQLGYSW
jgi:hypothetical protein